MKLSVLLTLIALLLLPGHAHGEEMDSIAAQSTPVPTTAPELSPTSKPITTPKPYDWCTSDGCGYNNSLPTPDMKCGACSYAVTTKKEVLNNNTNTSAPSPTTQDKPSLNSQAKLQRPNTNISVISPKPSISSHSAATRISSKKGSEKNKIHAINKNFIENILSSFLKLLKIK